MKDTKAARDEFISLMVTYRELTNISYRTGQFDPTAIEPTTTITLKTGEFLKGTLLSIDNVGIAMWVGRRHRYITYKRINLEATHTIETVLKDR